MGLRVGGAVAAVALLLLAPTTVSANQNFTRLSCNSNLANAGCSLWTGLVGGSPIINTKVTIPCGRCITMNAPPALTLNGGLDIQGKLVFPNNYKIHLKTPFITVQGELHMTSTKPVNGQEDVKITLIGINNNRFRPAGNNANNCGGGDCTIGVKPVIVAGGQLFINGLPNNFPTWTKLQDVTSSTSNSAGVTGFSQYHSPITGQGCPADGIFIQEDFSNVAALVSNPNYHMEGTLGTHFRYTGQSLQVFNRYSKRHAPSFDLGSIRHCLEAGVEYIMTARIKLTDANAPTANKATPCGANHVNCLRIEYQYMEPDAENNQVRSDWFYNELATHKNLNAQTFTISQVVKFDAGQLNANHVYEALRFANLPANIDIEIFEFNLRLPPPAAFKNANNVCDDIGPANADAELDALSAFPVKEFAGHTELVVAREPNNAQNPTNYFKVTGREGHGTWAGDIMHWKVPIGCINAHAQFDISFDVRVHSAAAPTLKVLFMITRPSNQRSYPTLATCSLRNGNWVKCAATYTIPADMMKGDEETIDLFFDTPGAPTVDIDFDNLKFASSGGGPTDTIVVANTVQGKWAAGAEVMITSHTMGWQDDQVRTIVGVSNGPTGFTKLRLNSAIRRPITVSENPIYASEVALLSRNIVFEGFKESGNYELIGMHMMVFHTPKIVQKLEGIEVRNGGQQGTLGRYPIHFHFCHDVPDSMVSKNLIRASNQRCAVVHATDMLTVQENVAYDTRGHCFMTEDGMERFNKFIKNLGARTHAVSRLIPDNGSNGKESDDRPATFWIVNPTNDYIGNVAAGSQNSGFWFELRTFVRGSAGDDYEFNPRRMSIGEFRDNVAHSNNDKGFRTYPDGYIPDEKASFLNSYSFRNRIHGLFFHNSQNLAVVGGRFADNGIGLDFDRVDYVELTGTQIVGESSEYKSVRTTQNTATVCRGDGRIKAIELHSFARNVEHYGLQADIKNIAIKGFDPVSSNCPKSVAVHLDDEVRWKTADYFTTLSGVRIDSSSPRFDFCDTVSAGLTDFYLVDRTSGLKPTSSSASGISTAISNDPNMKRMISNSGAICIDDAPRCASYCQNTCLRTVSYFVDPTAGNYTLRVCKRNSPSTCVDDSGSFYYDNQNDAAEDNHRNYDHERYRIYAAHLPAGQYDAKFVDRNGNLAWPTVAREQYEVNMCEGTSGLNDGDVILIQPPADEAQCRSLIRNGNAQSSTTYAKGWRHHNGGVKIETGKGLGGSNALGSVRRRSAWDAISQFLDTRCMSWAVGKMYQIRGYVKVTNTNGSLFFCDPSITNCPSIAIGYYDQDNIYREIRNVAIIRSTSALNDGFQYIQGYFKVPNEVAASSIVDLLVKRNRSDKWMYIDDISMNLVTDASQFQCTDGENLVLNGNFNGGNTLHWDDRDAEGLKIITPGYGGSGFALEMKTGAAQQIINSDCFNAGERYAIKAKFRLLDGAGQGVACNLYTNNIRCPEAFLQFKRGESDYIYRNAFGLGPQTTGSWNTIQSYWTLDQDMANSLETKISFTRVPSGHSLVVDNIEVVMVPQQCSGNVAPFSNMDYGAARIWRNFGSTLVRDYSPGRGGSGLAIHVTGRSNTWHGAWMDFNQYGDKRCLEAKGQTWEIIGQVRLLIAGTNVGDTCVATVSAERCPKFWVKLVADNSGTSLVEATLPTSSPNTWDAAGFNMIRSTFTVPTDGFTSITNAQFGIIDAKLGVDLVIDDVIIRPI